MNFWTFRHRILFGSRVRCLLAYLELCHSKRFVYICLGYNENFQTKLIKNFRKQKHTYQFCFLKVYQCIIKIQSDSDLFVINDDLLGDQYICFWAFISNMGHLLYFTLQVKSTQIATNYTQIAEICCLRHVSF